MGEWSKESIENVEEKLGVTPATGLSIAEASARLKKYGNNHLQAQKKINPFALFFSQFRDVLTIVLIISASVSLALSFIEDGGSIRESLLIFAIVIAIAIIGFFNEYRAEKTVQALGKLVGQNAEVRRGGQSMSVSADQLVPGDIVILSEGQKIPADLRLFKVRNLLVNEASLTGESLPVEKNTLTINNNAPLGDQKNMAFAGTFVSAGTAEGIVVETAQTTELGKIATLVNTIEVDETPMQRKLNDLGKKLGLFILLICAVVFVIVFFLVSEAVDRSLLQRLIFAFTAAVALAVAAIPEGLAFVVRISLALGARRMAGKHALVRRLSAVEALGSTDIICADKTGTLTRGEMTVREIYTTASHYDVSGRGYQLEGEV
ncbi:MAG: HAD-IC family P-type ATPase, partial [Patescibacteria group bacterium]